MGIPIDPTTGNLAGSTPQLLQFQNDFLPAQATTEIDYRANLASYPLTPAHDDAVPGSELLQPANFSANPIAGAPSPARITGVGATLAPDAVASLTANDISSLSAVARQLVNINGIDIAVAAGDDAATLVNRYQCADCQHRRHRFARRDLASRAQHLGCRHAIQIGGTSTLGLLNQLGLTVGTTQPTNLLTQSAAAAGQTMTITFGSNPPEVLTFGYGAGQISTLGRPEHRTDGIFHRCRLREHAQRQHHSGGQQSDRHNHDRRHRSAACLRHANGIGPARERNRGRERPDDLPQRDGQRRRGDRLRRLGHAGEHPAPVGQGRWLGRRRR